MRMWPSHGTFSILPSKAAYFHSSSATMKEVVLVLVISVWAAFAVGELHILALLTFSVVYPGLQENQRYLWKCCSVLFNPNLFLLHMYKLKSRGRKYSLNVIGIKAGNQIQTFQTQDH